MTQQRKEEEASYNNPRNIRMDQGYESTPYTRAKEAAATSPASDEARKLADEGCICQGCGLRYRVDVFLPDEAWNAIKPEGKPDGGGLLCGRCIIDRIEDRGVFGAFELRAQLDAGVGASVEAVIQDFLSGYQDSFGDMDEEGIRLFAKHIVAATAPPSGDAVREALTEQETDARDHLIRLATAEAAHWDKEAEKARASPVADDPEFWALRKTKRANAYRAVINLLSLPQPSRPRGKRK